MLLAAAVGELVAQTPEGLEGTLLVLNKSGNDVSFLDLASGRIFRTLPTCVGPHELIVSDDGRWAVATDYGGGGSGGRSLTVIDVASERIARTVDLSLYPRPHGIDFLPGDSILAITSEASRNIVFVRLSDGEVTGAIDTGQGGSHMLALAGAGSRIYTSNGQGNSVSELDVVSGQRLRMLLCRPAPRPSPSPKTARSVGGE